MLSSSTSSIPKVAQIPQHIAIIMDGNGRWAKKRLLPRIAGHKQGLESVRNIIKACSIHGVAYLTLFAFSTENWRRPADEVTFLMSLFMEALKREVNKLHQLSIAINYGGRWDIVNAVNEYRKKNHFKKPFTQKNLIQNLSLNFAPDPDLLIRTGGEQRISNFLIWQFSYTELYFTETLWPDFNEKAFTSALIEFQKRERRYGKTSEQI